MPLSITRNRFSVYLDAAEIMQHGVMFLDREGNLLSVNRRFAQELGYSKDQFEPKTIFQVNPHFNLLDWKKLWEELLENGQVSLDTEHITSQGKALPVKLRGILLEGELCQAIVEGDLSESNEDLYLARFCLDNVQEMVTWAAPDSRIFYANNAARQTLGFSADELLGTKIPDLEPDFDHADWERRWAELKAKKWLKKEALRLTKSGEPIPVELSLHYMNYNGREYEMAFVRDLRQQREQDKRIALSYRALEEASQMIYWLNPDGRFIYANHAFSEKLGYDHEELMHLHLWDIEPEMTEETWLGRWQDLKEKGRLELDATRLTKTGEPIPVRLYLNYLSFNGKEYNLAFASDLRSRKKLEEVITLSSDTLNQSPDMVFWLNEDGSFYNFNDTFVKMTGYKRQEIETMHLLDFFPEFDEQAFRKGWEKLQAGQVLSSEMEITGKGGKRISVESIVKMIPFEGKQYSSTVLRDIRQRKAKEEEMNAYIRENENLRQQLAQENILLKEEMQVERSFENIISQSKNYKKVLQQVAQVAETNATVLLLGETGTGKELLAKAIHDLSPRSGRPLVKVNCSALPENLIESELFGHEKGAFTGAYQRKIGRFEVAHKGTIFLDEIGELPLDLQSKLLRVLQESEFERVGGTETIKVDVRVVAATNRNLEELVEKGLFREDLFYRLNVFPIFNIPLRERRDDIRPLTMHFIKKYNQKMGRHIEEIPEQLMKELEQYEFPGNVRELENLIERAIILSPGRKLVGHFQFKKSKDNKKGVFKHMEDLQQEHILEALRRTNGKVTGKGGAAELLGMKDKTLYSRMQKFGMGRHDYAN